MPFTKPLLALIIAFCVIFSVFTLSQSIAQPTAPGPTPDWVEVEDAGVAMTDAQVPPGDTKITPEEIEKNPVGAVKSFIDAIKDKNWKMVASLVLALLMLGLGKVRDKVKWFKGDRGGAILVAVLGLLGGFVAALQSGAAIDYMLALGVMGAVWMAVGGVTWVKRIIWPKDEPAPTATSEADTAKVRPIK